MNKREAAIVSAYTGYLIGEFAEMHKYIEELLGHSVFTHQLGDKATFDKIQQLSKKDFVSISIQS